MTQSARLHVKAHYKLVWKKQINYHHTAMSQIIITNDWSVRQKLTAIIEVRFRISRLPWVWRCILMHCGLNIWSLTRLPGRWEHVKREYLLWRWAAGVQVVESNRRAMSSHVRVTRFGGVSGCEYEVTAVQMTVKNMLWIGGFDFTSWETPSLFHIRVTAAHYLPASLVRSARHRHGADTTGCTHHLTSNFLATHFLVYTGENASD